MVLVIARQEVTRLFLSPLSWLILGLNQFLLAILLFLLLGSYLEQPGAHSGHGITEVVIGGTLRWAGWIALVLIPILSMHLVSGERRRGTLALLLSAPVSLTGIVLGKYLGLLLFLLCSVAMTGLMLASLAAGTALDPGQLSAGLGALALLWAALAALGLLASTLTRHPAMAAALTLGMVLGLATLPATPGGGAAQVYTYLSLLRHYQALTSGMVSSADACYYLLLAATCIALSIWRLDAERRWR